VTPSKVIVLADTAERAEEIDLSRAEASRARAQAAISQRGTLEDLAQSEAALRRANLRLQIGQRRASRRRGSGLGDGTDNQL
jgi:F-type H+-transporting ATPase subunit epsilon